MKQASDFLREAAQVIEERGKLRDNEEGERSMKRAVEAYNALCGSRMEGELDGWLFMCVLKLARATAGKPHLDDAVDLAGYAALAAECIEREVERSEDSSLMAAIVKQPAGEAEDCVELGMWNLSKYADPYTGEIRVPKDDGWVEHDLSGCPLKSGTVVEVRYRCGDTEVITVRSRDNLLWRELPDLPDYKHDIVAYRVVKERNEVSTEE
jgi:hypothetical protein